MASSKRAKTSTTTPTTSAPAATTAAAPTAFPAAATVRTTGSGREKISRSATASPIDSIRVSCFMNAQYHAAREGALDNVHRWIMFLIILFGAGALADIFPKDWRLITRITEIGFKEIFALGASE